MGEKTLIDDYREQVRQIMLKATKENGEPRLTEKEVKDNTPEETAAMLLSK